MPLTVPFGLKQSSTTGSSRGMHGYRNYVNQPTKRAKG